MRRAGENEVAVIRSEADKKVSPRLGQAQAVRPQIVGAALASVPRQPGVAAALFALPELQATLKRPGRTVLAAPGTAGRLLDSQPASVVPRSKRKYTIS